MIICFISELWHKSKPLNCLRITNIIEIWWQEKKHSLLHAFIICSDHSSKKIKQMTINEKELKPSTRRVSLVEQELLTLSEQLSSPPVFSGVRVTWSLVLYVCFVDHCLSFCTFSFGHCVVCSSSIYDSDYPYSIFKVLLHPLTKVNFWPVRTVSCNFVKNIFQRKIVEISK